MSWSNVFHDFTYQPPILFQSYSILVSKIVGGSPHMSMSMYKYLGKVWFACPFASGTTTYVGMRTFREPPQVQVRQVRMSLLGKSFRLLRCQADT